MKRLKPEFWILGTLFFCLLLIIATALTRADGYFLIAINSPFFLTALFFLFLFIREKQKSKRKVLKKNRKVSQLNRKIFSLEKRIKLLEEETELLKKENEAIFEEKNLLEHKALHDPITKLPNRSFLIEKLSFLMNLCRRVPSMKFYVLFIDLVRFKNINDYLGHTIGDRMLALVAKRIKRVVGVEDVVTRLGGDEFAVIISDPLSTKKVQELALEIYKSVTSSPFPIRKQRIEIKLHIGLAAYDPSHTEPEDILRDADIAMHYAKGKGIPVAFFDENLKNQFLESAEIERDLRYAIQENQFILFYQPIISLKDGELVGFEALLRWNHPVKGFISPSKFIPVAEDTGLIIPITDWVLTEACSQAASWKKINPELTISVNISSKHFAMETLSKELSEIIKKTGADARNLKLEVTETSAMEDPALTMQLLTELKNLGVRLSIDDFGTGYSNLSQLYRLPFDSIKIDRSFISSIGKDGERPAILEAIITLGKNLGMKLVAEGIETEYQFKTLRSIGCDYGQGYLIAKPMPKEEIEKQILNKNQQKLFLSKNLDMLFEIERRM